METVGKSPLKDRLLARAGEMHAALNRARSGVEGRPLPTMDVGGVALMALPFDETVKRTAEQARAGFPGALDAHPRRGGGDLWWRNRVGIIKFTFIDALAAGYRATGEEDYAEAARDYIEDFLTYFAEGAPWDGAAVRITTRLARPPADGWLGALPYFLDSTVFDEEFVQRVIQSVRDQLHYLMEEILPQQKPGNIRLFQANTLLWAGLLLQHLPEAAECLQTARRLYADTARRDIEADGSHVEHEPNYHRLYRGTFYNLAIWARAFPEAELGEYADVALRVFDYSLAGSKPSGDTCGLQEGKSAWIGGPGLARPLAQYETLQRLAGREPAPPALWMSCPDAGHVFMRDSWDPDAVYLVFDATRWGGAHSHLGRNGVLLHAYGRTLLTNAGSLSYAMQHKGHEGDELDNRMGFYGKSTRSKSTCTLNDWNQAPTNADVLVSHHAPECHAVLSHYSGGYWPGPYGWYWPEGFGAGLHAFHERLLIWLTGGVAVVVDTVNRWPEDRFGCEAQQSPSLQMHWQLTPGAVELDADSGRLVTRHEDANVLMLFPKLSEGMELTLHEGELDPIRGWVSTGGAGRRFLEERGVFDDAPLSGWRERTYAPAPLLRACADPMREYIAEMVTVILPFRGKEEPPLRARFGGGLDGRGIRKGNAWGTLERADGTRDEIVWSLGLNAPIGSHGALATDASVLHVRRDAEGTVLGGTGLDGTWCEGEGAEHIAIHR